MRSRDACCPRSTARSRVFRRARIRRPVPRSGGENRSVLICSPRGLRREGASMRMFQVCVCGQPLQCNEGPTPEPKGSEILLKVLAAGVCHSDLHLADGYFDLGGGKKMSLEDRSEEHT